MIRLNRLNVRFVQPGTLNNMAQNAFKACYVTNQPRPAAASFRMPNIAEPHAEQHAQPDVPHRQPDLPHGQPPAAENQKPVSCGALLYANDPTGQLGVIVGMEATESYGYLPFKGRPEQNETLEQAAIREVYEETCGLILVNQIDLRHQFETAHKKYYIGLIKVPYEIVEQFEQKRAVETNACRMEKRKIKFFPLSQLYNKEIHPLSRLSVKFWRASIV